MPATSVFDSAVNEHDVVQQIYINLGKASANLGAALAHPERRSIIVDGCLKRFCLASDLSWKALNACLVARGVAEPKTPRETFKAAFAAGLIDAEDIWLDMLDARNQTSHAYDETMAMAIYVQLPGFWRQLHQLSERLLAEFQPAVGSAP